MLAKVLSDNVLVGVEVLKSSIAHLRATGETEESIRGESDETSLRLFARVFFSTIETGRGPRKASAKSDFQDRMLAYMQARGIGSELSDKKRRQLARFLTWKANKEGDKTFKAGGRQIYSEALNKFADQLIKAIAKDTATEIALEIKGIFKR